jgi:leader peptidase (prepilin peptidase)/N-methyltransferase
MPQTIYVLGAVLSFVMGAVVGSFLNVCIWRLPRDESIIYPDSHCPQCDTRLRAWDLVPLLSIIFLRAKCRFCHAPISWRYFGVELLTALVFLALWWRWEVSVELFFYAAFSALLIAIFFIDLDHMIIPDELSLAGVGLGVAKNIIDIVAHRPGGFVAPFTIPGAGWVVTILPASLVGIVAAVAVFAGIDLFSRLVFKREGMGGGDLKLGAAIGALIGPGLALLSFGMAVVAGAALGVVLIGARLVLRRYEGPAYIPFGPFMVVTAWMCMIAPQPVSRTAQALWESWLRSCGA